MTSLLPGARELELSTPLAIPGKFQANTGQIVTKNLGKTPKPVLVVRALSELSTQNTVLVPQHKHQLYIYACYNYVQFVFVQQSNFCFRKTCRCSVVEITEQLSVGG